MKAADGDLRAGTKRKAADLDLRVRLEHTAGQGTSTESHGVIRACSGTGGPVNGKLGGPAHGCGGAHSGTRDLWPADRDRGPGGTWPATRLW